MRLTEPQKQRVADFLREVAHELGDVPGDERRERLRALNSQIGRRLAALGAPAPSDAELEAVLRQCRPQMATPLPEEDIEDIAAEVDEEEDRVWLGVCAALSALSGLDATLLRAFAVVLGLLTGPLAIALYLVLFAAFHATGKLPHLPPIRWRAVAGFAAFTVATAVILHAVARLLLELLRRVYALASDAAFEALPYWRWMLERSGNRLAWALAVLLPLAILAALPLAGGWDATLRKVVKAGLALYAFALSIALGSVVAMAIMGILEQFI